MWVPQPAESSNGGVAIRVPSPSPSPSHSSGFINNHPMDQVNSVPFTSSASSNPPSPYHRGSPSLPPQQSPVLNSLELGVLPPSIGGGGTAQSLSVPYLKRERSKSETFSQRPAWNLGINSYQQPQQTSLPMHSGIPSDLSPRFSESNFPYISQPGSAGPYQTNFPPAHMGSPHANSFGPPITQQQQQQQLNNNLLGTDDMYLGVDASMRRARSDGHRRGAKSEDFSRSTDYNLTQGLLAPPTTHPSLMVPGEQFGRGRTNGLTHHRRTSSGSRSHERGGSISGNSSVRASPYPSPNASPMMSYSQLQPDVNTVNMNSLNLREATQQQQPAPQSNVPVARPHVTTSATQAASIGRRTSEATFTCPVPGCGSTFTRHFNLKGLSGSLTIGSR